MKYIKMAVIFIVLLQIARGLFSENDRFKKISDTKFEVKILTGSEGTLATSTNNNAYPEIVYNKIDEILRKRDFCDSDFKILNSKPTAKRSHGPISKWAIKEVKYITVTGMCL